MPTLARDQRPWDIPAQQYPALQHELDQFGADGLFARVLTRPNHPTTKPARAVALGGTNRVSRAAGFVITHGGASLVLIRDRAAAPAARQVLNALRPTIVSGPADHVGLVAPVLPTTRARAMSLAANAPTPSGVPPDPRARPATHDDIPALQRVLSRGGFGNHWLGEPAAAALAQQIDLAIVVLAVDQGQVAATAAGTGWTDRWLLIDTLAVDPSHRRRGLARAVGRALADHAYERGLGICWLHSDTNTMNLSVIPLMRTVQFRPWRSLDLAWPPPPAAAR